MAGANANQGLRLRSYFARTVESAVETARRELGPDALLVDSRKAPPGSARHGDYEVVFAAMPAPETPQAAAQPELGDGGSGSFLSDVARLSSSLSEIADILSHGKLAWLLEPGAGDRCAALSRLIAAGVEPELAARIVRKLGAALAAKGGAANAPGLRAVPPNGPARPHGVCSDLLDSQLIGEMETMFTVDGNLAASGGTGKAVALVGPPGAGKTTSLVKLAAVYGLKARRPIQLLSIDTRRIAACEQLRTFATVLAVGVQVAETTLALSQAIEEHRGKELIFIDTPGYSSSCMEDGAELARCLAKRPEVETHLVLPASMKPADLRRCVDRFEVFRPARLLFTRLDETASCGSIFSEAVRTGKTLSFLGTGQAIPEDIEPATKQRVMELMFRNQAERTSTAA